MLFKKKKKEDIDNVNEPAVNPFGEAVMETIEQASEVVPVNYGPTVEPVASVAEPVVNQDSVYQNSDFSVETDQTNSSFNETSTVVNPVETPVAVEPVNVEVNEPKMETDDIENMSVDDIFHDVPKKSKVEFCPNCGTRLADGMNVCSLCGTSVN